MSLRTRTSSITKSTATESASEDATLIVRPQASAQPSFPQRAISQTLTTTANLANLLPTGTVLSFQLLIPTFTNNGSCDPVTRLMTQFLLLLLASSCFLASFTDSFRSPEDGKVYYGFATFKGMWLFDYVSSPIPDLTKYRITFIDAVHAVLSVFIFAAIALRDANVVKCFYPMPQQGTQQFLNIAPVGLGVICSSMFVVFPCRRHGIGYPVSSGNN